MTTNNTKITVEKPRPLGITILAALQILGGALALLGGAYSLGALGVMGGGAVVALLLLCMGFVGIPMTLSWGLLKGKKWAWTIMIILYVLSIIGSSISLNLIGIIITALVIYYLYQPHVKDFFGKRAEKKVNGETVEDPITNVEPGVQNG